MHGLSKYDPSYAAIVRKLCLLVHGITNKQIAEFFEVSEGAISNWIGDIPEFREAIHWGRKHADIEVASAAYKSAIGYETIQSHINRRGELVQVKTFIPGDVRAQMFWLSARQPDLWKPKQDSALPEGGTLAPIGSAEIVEVARKIAFILARAAYQGDATTVESKEIENGSNPRKT